MRIVRPIVADRRLQNLKRLMQIGRSSSNYPPAKPDFALQQPLSVSTHAANHHEVRLVQLCFDFYMIEARPENLIGDRAYDSDPLDAELRKDGIEMIAPHRGNRSKLPTQDRRRLSRYMRRWLVERFFAWIQWQRRILIRWEYHAHNFLGFVQLACLVILFKRF
jgi:transposase